MPKNLLRLGLAAIWLLIVPLVLPLLHRFMHDRWTMENGSQQYLWGAIAAVVWYAVLWVVFPRFGALHSLQTAPLFVFLAASIVWYGGYVVLCVINCVGDESPGMIVEVRLVKQLKNLVRFAVATGPGTGSEFECTIEQWGPIGVGGHRFLLHHGRRGIPWGRIVRSAE